MFKNKIFIRIAAVITILTGISLVVDPDDVSKTFIVVTGLVMMIGGIKGLFASFEPKETTP